MPDAQPAPCGASPAHLAARTSFASSQPHACEVLAVAFGIARDEAETYPCGVLHGEFRGDDVVTAIAREMVCAAEHT